MLWNASRREKSAACGSCGRSSKKKQYLSLAADLIGAVFRASAGDAGGGKIPAGLVGKAARIPYEAQTARVRTMKRRTRKTVSCRSSLRDRRAAELCRRWLFRSWTSTALVAAIVDDRAAATMRAGNQIVAHPAVAKTGILRRPSIIGRSLEDLKPGLGHRGNHLCRRPRVHDSRAQG